MAEAELWPSHVFFFLIINETRRNCKRSKEEMGLPHAIYEQRELSQTLHMPSKFIPVAPLEDSQSLFDLYAVLPAGRPGDASGPFSLPF